MGQAYISGEKRAQGDTWRGHRKAETDWNDVATSQGARGHGKLKVTRTDFSLGTSGEQSPDITLISPFQPPQL